jgi:hypothetical protein
MAACAAYQGPADVSRSKHGAQINGTPGSPSATTTINGNQLPPMPQPFAGKIERNAAQSTPYWPMRVVPSKGAPNVLLIMTDDTGFGVSSTFGGVAARSAAWCQISTPADLVIQLPAPVAIPIKVAVMRRHRQDGEPPFRPITKMLRPRLRSANASTNGKRHPPGGEIRGLEVCLISLCA